MNLEGEKGTENIEKVAKLETLRIRIKEICLSSEYDPLKNSDDPDSESKIVGANYSGQSTAPQLGDYALGVKEKISYHEMMLRMKGLEDWKPRKKKAIEAISSAATNLLYPPNDVEATSPDMTYPIEKIIFEEEWKYLMDIFELVEAGSDVSPDVYPTFVCNRVHKIGAIKDEEKRKRMAGILSYITHHIGYKDMHSAKSTRRRHELPSILAQRFSSLFSEKEDGSLPFLKELLLINYVLVLSLFADDFRSDMTDIAKDLRWSPILLRDHYIYLGCKFSEEKGVVATLSAPLGVRVTKRKYRRTRR